MLTEQQEEKIIHIPDTKKLKEFIKPLYIIDDYMDSYSNYEKFINSINNIIKGCIEHKECREYIVKFKFYKEDKEIYELQLRHFYVNIVLWYPFIYLHNIDNILNKKFILNCFTDIPKITDYINDRIIIKLRDYSIKNVRLNKSISQVLYYLRNISVDYSMIMNLSISTETFLEMYENPRMKEIMETKFPINMQPALIEEHLHDLTREEIEIIKGIKDNAVGIILQTGKGIKDKQLAEMTIALGLNPTLEGETIPFPMNNSTLIGGLDKPSYLYIGSLGSRKALISNKMVMGQAGYFGKIILLLARTLALSKTVSDCGTKHFIEVHINSAKMLSKYNFRYYKLSKDPNEELKLLKFKKDKEKLVGKTLYFRSPTKCACGNDEVCHKCFGRGSLLNLDIADGVSGFEVEETSKEVNQMVLSTKHLLTTISKLIKFNPEFYNFFKLYAGEIVPIINESDKNNLDDYAIFIDTRDLLKTDELDDDSPFNTYINNSFKVINLLTKEEYVIQSEGDQEMFLTDDSLNLLKRGKGFIKFKDMDMDTTLFSINFENNELTKPLYDLMDLLNKSKKDDTTITVDEMCQKFTELLVEANIKATALSGEVIINRLLRSTDDDYKHPDFSRIVEPKYRIFTILKSLECNPSALLGLSAQDIKRQLLSDDLVTKRTGTSYLDPFFREEVDNSLLHEYRKKIKKMKEEMDDLLD